MTMSVQQARTVLSITEPEPTDRAIRVAYHRLALKRHPDMEGGSDAAFVEITSAKNTLLEQAREEHPVPSWFATVYGVHVKPYLRIDQVVKAFLAQLSPGQIGTVWSVSKSADARAIIGEDVLSELQKQVMKISDRITIRPSLESALTQLLYPLEFEEETFYVPLWHSHVEFDCKGRILIVNIDTLVPPHITIDSDNVIHVNVAHSAAALLRQGYLDVAVGEHKFTVPASSIRMVCSQSISLGCVGLPYIHHCDPLNVSTRMEIMVHLILSMD